MEIVSIGITAPTCRLRERLTAELKFLMDEGVAVELSESTGRTYNCLTLSVAASPQSTFTYTDLRGLGRQYTANVLADFLVDEWEQQVLKQMVAKDFGYFSSDEQRKILKLSDKILNGEDLYALSRKVKLRENIQDYLEQNRHINADGFLRFRMGAYLNDLRDSLSKAVDEYLVEKEYSEFIRLLRYFVEIQDPKLPLVHVIMRQNGTCQIYDENRKQLQHEYLENFEAGADPEVSYEDLLISALITLAPESIILHTSSFEAKQEMCDTIKSIFEGRVQECVKCDLCEICLPARAAKPVLPRA